MKAFTALRILCCLLLTAGTVVSAHGTEQGSAYRYWQQATRFYDAPVKAIPLYELALKTPFTGEDARLMRQWCHENLSLNNPRSDAELKAYMDGMIINNLSRCYLKTGQAKKAEVLLRKMNAKSLKGVPQPELAKFAGQVQSASGERNIESSIRNHAPTQKQDSSYWHSRALYFQGRNEIAEADKAFEKALALAPSPENPNLMPGRLHIYEDYNRYLKSTNRPEMLAAITRKELAAAPPDSFYASRMLCRLSDIPAETPVVQANDTSIWNHLEKRKTWGFNEQQMLKVLIKQMEFTKFAVKMEQLSAGADPSKSFRAGMLFNETGHYQDAAQHLRYVYKSMPPTFDPKHYMVSGDDVDYVSCMRALITAYEKTGQSDKVAEIKAKLE